ncbi:hypothetical protein JCM33374_g4998 [Metschnikowia sp. JCM 33374]|nr:hypothetical protein JCM33374_g4998 [Metschnikowia sp. JCM 33374]
MSVYQAQGKPLSQQALYQQKLKQGFYNSPGKASVGVASSASDTAALLAASTDLTVKPSYERLRAAPEAHNAALAVKLEKSKDAVPEPTPNPDLGIPSSYNRGSVYKQAHTNSTSTMSLRTTPEKLVAKHGLSSKPTPASTLNIAKISQVADKNSSSLLNKRFNPGQDHRSGLASKPIESNKNQELSAAQSAGRALTLKHGSGYTDSISTQKRSNTFQAADVVDATLLAAASAKAKERLDSLNSGNQLNYKEQAQLYSKALAAAQKNSEERLKSHKSGMVDLGGGLSLPLSEVDKLANLIVQPVLNDIDTKAKSQREFDEAQQTKQTELKSLHAKAKKDEENRKQSEKIQRLKEKDARVQANEDKKKAEDQKFTDYQGEQNAIVENKDKELRDLQAKYAEEKEALLKEKKDNEDRISEEEGGLIKDRKEELEKMQKEKDEILKPTLDELKVETGKLKELTDTKTQLSTEVQSAEKLKAENEAKIKELKEKLESTNTKIESTTSEHKEFFEKRETTDKEVKELTESSEKTFKEVEATHKELDGEIEALTKEKEENIATKASHKKDIYSQIDEKVKGEHEVNKELPEHLQDSIDEDKIRDTGSLFSVDEKKVAKKEEKKEEPKEVKKEEPKEEKKEEKKLEKVLPVKKEAIKPKKAQPKVEESPKKKGFRARIKDAFTSTSLPSVKSDSKAKTASGKVKATEAKVDAKSTKADVKEAVKDTKAEVKDAVKDTKTEVKEAEKDTKTEVKESAKETKAEVKDAAKDTKAAEKDVKVDKSESISTSNFDDALSIHEDGKKAGLFKEEI